MTPSNITTVSDVKALALEQGWDYQAVEPATRQRQDISRTIEEEIVDFLANTDSDLKNYVETYEVPREGRLKHNSRIHAVYDYSVPETFICRLPGASLVQRDGLIMTSTRALLTQSIAQRSPVQIRYTYAGGRGSGEPIYSPGSHVSLLCFAPYNYYHWSLDALLRLALLAAKDTSYKVIVPTVSPRFVRQLLELLGIAEERVVVYRDAEIVTDEIILSVPGESPAKPKRAHVWAQRQRLMRSAGVDPAANAPKRRLYISRARSRRPILNEDAMLPILRAHGFEIIYNEDLTVAEQIALFAQASCVVGAHGAGMTNVVFAPPGTTVVEIFNRALWFDCYLKIGSLLGHRHWHLFAENVDTESWAIRVDTRKLDKLLTYALRNLP